jgi:hypothetical protein
MCEGRSLQALTPDTQSVSALTGRGRPGAGFDSRNELASSAEVETDGRPSSLLGLFASSASALADIQSGREAAQIARYNSKIARKQAKLVESRTQADVSAVSRRARLVSGGQRASAAAQGVSVDTGSAADIQEETGFLSGEEIRRIKNNAALESFGFKVRDHTFKRAGENARRSAAYGAASTLLSAAHQSGRFG